MGLTEQDKIHAHLCCSLPPRPLFSLFPLQYFPSLLSSKAGYLKRHAFDVSITLLDTHSSDWHWCQGGVSPFVRAREMNCWNTLCIHMARSQVVLNKVKWNVVREWTDVLIQIHRFSTIAVLHLADDMSRWQTFPLSWGECNCTAVLLAVSYNCVTSVWREVNIKRYYMFDI